MKGALVYLFFMISLLEKAICKYERPNYVIMVADDIGWGDFGANWAPNKDVTPNLNNLALLGLRFTNFHSGASSSSASRASLLTGRLGLRTGVVKDFTPKSRGGLPLNETTIAEVLKENGYHTGMIGNWHLGITPPYHPRSRGFDFYYGIPYSNDMGCLDEFAYDLPECKTCPKKEFHWGKNMKKTAACKEYESAVPLYKDYDIIEQPVDLVNLPEKYASNAIHFIETAVKIKKPFLLYIAFSHMHVPLVRAKKFTNATNVKTVYADALHEMDDIIGRIVRALIKHEVFDNTMTWFTGGNGPWSAKCEFSGSQGPFLGSWLKNKFGGGSTAKYTTWEAGHRVPTVVTWPKSVPRNVTNKELNSILDIFPTILRFARIELPTNRKFDGEFLQLSSSSNPLPPRWFFLFYPNSGSEGTMGAIDAAGMNEYKLIWRTGGNGAKDCGGKVAPLQEHDPLLVFNLMKDPAESTPLTEKTDYRVNLLVSSANQEKKQLLLDIENDNTTVADYSETPYAEPCCNPNRFYCRCKKD